MKKIIFILIMSVLTIGLQAQERTINSSKTTMKTGVTYVEYTAVAADTLMETNQDTIDFVFNNYNHESIGKIVFESQLDSIAGNDSIYYSVTGYNDLLSTGTSITTGGALINQLNEIVEISTYSITTDLSYRHYVLRFIQDDNNSYDGGASFDWIKAKLYYR